MEAHYAHLPLLASIAGWSSWSLVVIYDVNLTSVNGMAGHHQAYTIWYHALSTRAPYTSSRIPGISYAKVPEVHL